mmetsp:Transcript_10791/g.27787  ORF Transcript_10791/g.27787 Transcript_10791/m.27787 type:complete len:355 (+) Transcript_10791:333-1397(+)
MKEVALSRNEREFLLASLAAGARLDGRSPYDFRAVDLNFGQERGHLELSLGPTKVLAQTSCEVVEPSPSRPAEGVIRYNVELSPMAAASFEAGRPSAAGVEVQRIVERTLKESRAVETESLCIVAGEKVWAVRVDITVLNHGGNLVDAVALAALGSLLHFRKPHVDVIGSEVTIHTLESHVPDPLSVHHRPLCVSFVFTGDEAGSAVVDPERKEEAVAVGTLSLALNVHREVCAIHKLGGVALSPDQLLECMEIAHVKAGELAARLDIALKADEAQRSGDAARPPSLLELSKRRMTAAARDPVEVDMMEAHDAGHGAAAAAAVATAAAPVPLAAGAAELFEGGVTDGGTAWDNS